jgi:molecular chaperone GrpE
MAKKKRNQRSRRKRKKKATESSAPAGDPSPAKDPAEASEEQQDRAPEDRTVGGSPEAAPAQPEAASGDAPVADAHVADPAPPGTMEAAEADSEEEPTVEVRLREAETQRDEYLDLARRARADLENYRKRMERDRASHRSMAQAEVLKEFLKPLDDLDRAMGDAEVRRDFDTLFEGLGLVRTDLWKALSDVGLSRIEASPGTTFDPNVHEALVQVPHAEVPAGAIVEETTPGYCLGDRVLRAAKVVVSSGAPPVDESSEEAGA